MVVTRDVHEHLLSQLQLSVSVPPPPLRPHSRARMFNRAFANVFAPTALPGSSSQRHHRPGRTPPAQQPQKMRVLPMAQKHHAPRPPLLGVIAILAFLVLLADRVFLQARNVAIPNTQQVSIPPPQQLAQPLEQLPSDGTLRGVDPAKKAKSFDTGGANPIMYSRTKKEIPPCAKTGTKAKTFLVVFQSRSGSTAICTELRQHSEVHMEIMELLDQKKITRSNVTGALAETRKFFDEGIAKGLVPGFKIRPHNIVTAPDEWDKLVKEYDTRVIWQYRKNIVKSSIGTYALEYLGDNTAIGGIKRKDAVGDRCEMGVGCKFKIENMTGFHDTLKKRLYYEREIVRGVHALDRSGRCTLEVPYEDYLYHGSETIRDIQDFLGLKHEDNPPSRVKATRDSLCDAVENFDELCSNFYGCAVWQPYFEDMVNDCRCSRFANSPAKFCDTYFAGYGR